MVAVPGVSVSVQQFGLLIAFVGGVTDALQGFVLPPLIHAATHGPLLGPGRLRLLRVLSGVGVLLMLSATWQNSLALRDVRRLDQQQQHPAAGGS